MKRFCNMLSMTIFRINARSASSHKNERGKGAALPERLHPLEVDRAHQHNMDGYRARCGVRAGPVQYSWSTALPCPRL